MRSARRPSDVWTLPAPGGRARAASMPPPGPDPEDRGTDATRRRRAGTLTAAAAVGLLMVGVVVGTPADRADGGAVPGPLDVAAEDEAIAALGLYDAEHAAADALAERGDLFALPGPGEAAQVARGAVSRLEDAAAAVAADVGPSTLAGSYGADPAHAAFRAEVDGLARYAAQTALLASVHDTLYAGSGSSSDPRADVTDVLRGDEAEVRHGNDPRLAWASALADEVDGQGAGDRAAVGREATGRPSGARRPAGRGRSASPPCAPPTPLVCTGT